MSSSPSIDRTRLSDRVWVPAAVLVALVVLAWSNSFTAPFEMDDESSIVTNPTIRHLGHFDWITPPAGRGETVSGRPVLNLSFALNYAVGTLDVRGYHVVNVAIHMFAALTLFGLVRRTLQLPSVAEHYRVRATAIAFSVAAIWAVHPLQTQAVTYVVQRAESLMSLWFLLTLYAFVRAVRLASAGSSFRRTEPRSGPWLIVSSAACLLGMATKENMVSAPLAVLVFDRAFVAGSFSAAWRARTRFYLGLFATWVLLAVLVLSTGGNRGGSAGFDVGVGWGSYLLTQFPALVRYAALAFWPFPLVFEYGAFWVTTPASVLAQVVAVFAALATSAWLVRRAPKLAFVAAVGWALLAPTSLVPGTLQMIVEHRMYLPLASLVTFAVIGAAAALSGRRRWSAFAVGFVIVALVALTLARNRVYASPLALWSDTVAKRPENPRAHNNLGLALQHAGRVDEAVAHFQRAIALQPNHAFAHANLGSVLLRRRDWAGAEREFQAAVAADPHFASARVNLGVALTQLGRRDEAIAQYRVVVADEGGAQDAQTNLAALLVDSGSWDEADKLLRQVVSAAPQMADAHYQLARVREHAGALTDAEREYRDSVRLKPDDALPHLALANLLARRGATADADAEYRAAVRLDPTLAEARYGLGNLLAKQQRFELAMAEYGEVLRLAPEHVQARNNLANCQLASGRLREAIANYEAVLRARPQDRAVQRNLEIARQMLR